MKLRSLDLSFCGQITKDFPSKIPKHDSLVNLDISGCEILFEIDEQSLIEENFECSANICRLFQKIPFLQTVGIGTLNPKSKINWILLCKIEGAIKEREALGFWTGSLKLTVLEHQSAVLKRKSINRMKELLSDPGNISLFPFKKIINQSS